MNVEGEKMGKSDMAGDREEERVKTDSGEKIRQIRRRI